MRISYIKSKNDTESFILPKILGKKVIDLEDI